MPRKPDPIPPPVANRPPATSDAPTDLISPKEAAQLLSCDPATIRRWIATGELAGYRIIGRVRVSRGDVLALIHPINPAPPLESRREHESRAAETERVLRAAGILP